MEKREKTIVRRTFKLSPLPALGNLGFRGIPKFLQVFWVPRLLFGNLGKHEGADSQNTCALANSCYRRTTLP